MGQRWGKYLSSTWRSTAHQYDRTALGDLNSVVHRTDRETALKDVSGPPLGWDPPRLVTHWVHKLGDELVEH
jgi:hypothetical protein